MKFCSMMYRYSYIDRYSVKPRLLNLSWILNRKAKNVALAGRNIPLLIIWVFALYQLQLATKRNVVGAKSDIEILFEEVPFTLFEEKIERTREREKRNFYHEYFVVDQQNTRALVLATCAKTKLWEKYYWVQTKRQIDLTIVRFLFTYKTRYKCQLLNGG